MLPSRHGSQHIKGPVLTSGYHHQPSELFIPKVAGKNFNMMKQPPFFVSIQPKWCCAYKNHGAKAASLDVYKSAGCPELWPKRFTGGRGCDLALALLLDSFPLSLSKASVRLQKLPFVKRSEILT